MTEDVPADSRDALAPDQGELTMGGHRQWALPILRALDSLGGKGSPREVEAKVRALIGEQLTDLQWARVLRGNYVRWARHTLKKNGLVGGKQGVWELTPLGRSWSAARASDPIEVNRSIPELSPDEAGDLRAPVETVEVTDYEGYEIPILRILASAGSDKDELLGRLQSELSTLLLPGDARVMERGRPVWRYRASWALSNLKKLGAIRNPTTSRYEISEAGRVRLSQEEGSWSIEPFRGSRAKVRAGFGDAGSAAVGDAASSVVSSTWPTEPWRAFASEFEAEALAIAQRLRPDLEATPDRPLARNLVFYGPPGTGKTFMAKKVARALTEQDEPGIESRWRLVQFHPSYAYEDFVQGLRPALEERELRYKLHQGPFLQVCKAAEADPDHFHVLIIDEINRGDPARIFGELLYALEYRGESVDLAGGGSLVIPANLVVLGTMNSVDRSVALVDHALRRRFAFVRCDPNPEAIPSPRLGALLASFNEWLVAQLDVEHALGHSAFLNPALAKLSVADAIQRVWDHDVRPLLEEYFFGQPERLKAAHAEWNRLCVETEDDDESDIDDAAS